MSIEVKGWRLVVRREPHGEAQTVHVDVEDASGGDARPDAWLTSNAASVFIDGKLHHMEYKRYYFGCRSAPTGARDGFEAVQELVGKLANGRWRVLEIVRPGELTRDELVRRVRVALRALGVADCDDPIAALEALAEDTHRRAIEATDEHNAAVLRARAEGRAAGLREALDVAETCVKEMRQGDDLTAPGTGALCVQRGIEKLIKEASGG